MRLWLILLCLGTVSAAEIRIGFAQAIPPYVIAEKDSGLQVDILRAAFAGVGIQLRPVYLPNARLTEFYLQKKVDGITHYKPTMALTGFVTPPLIGLHNVAISLPRTDFAEIKMPDLSRLRVAAWQNAKKFLGAAYAEAVKNNIQYEEFGRFLPVQQLFINRVDVVISEQNVFHFYLGESPYRDQNIQISELFDTNLYHYLFAKKETMEWFERGMRLAYEQGLIEAVFRKYNGRMHLNRDAFAGMDCHFDKQVQACKKLPSNISAPN